MGTEPDEIKRKLRQLKKLEAEIRYKGKLLTGRESFVWDQFFSTKNDHENVRYPIEKIAKMEKQEYKNALSEYFSMVYYILYKENGIYNRELFDPALLRELDLPPDSTSADVKKRFRELVMIFHPDHGGDSAKFIWLMNIYQKLLERN